MLGLGSFPLRLRQIDAILSKLWRPLREPVPALGPLFVVILLVVLFLAAPRVLIAPDRHMGGAGSRRRVFACPMPRIAALLQRLCFQGGVRTWRQVR